MLLSFSDFENGGEEGVGGGGGRERECMPQCIYYMGQLKFKVF